MTLLQSGIAKPSSGYDIEQSLRFDDGDSAYLSRAQSNGNQDRWTWSGWVKRGNLGSTQCLFATSDGAATSFDAKFTSSDTINVYNYLGGGFGAQLITNRVFRDVSSWYHIVIVYDSGNATEAHRLRIYVNGIEESSFSTTNYPSVDENSDLNVSGSGLDIGRQKNGAEFFDGYLAEVHLIDGTALTPASFGKTDSATNQWVPVEYSGSYGTNGFYLKFQDSSALGDDSSGNTNDFAVTNLVATDQVLDSPTNNFATLNPLDYQGSITASEGNLTATTSSGDPTMKATFALPSTGKWYWEFLMQYSTSMMIGVVDQTSTGAAYSSNKAVLYSSGLGTKYNFSSVASYGASWTTGDLMGVAFNRDDNEITFYKNNSAQPTLTIGGTADQRSRLIPLIVTGTGGTGGGTFNFGQDSSFAGAKTAQDNTDGNGIGDFYYTPPSGYLALCTDNLSDPSIADPTKHFNTVLYTGSDSSADRAITGVGFQPDLVWSKIRSTSFIHLLYDSVRGAGKALRSNATNAEDSDYSTGYLSSFDSDGFSTVAGSTENTRHNYTSQTYAVWNWKAGGTASSITAGSIDGTNPTITSSVSANTTAGFSIVSWTGDTTSATIGHGLSQAPELIIIKSRDGTPGSWNWPSYSKPTGTGGYINLDQSNAWTANSGFYGTAPTASVFSPGSHSYVSGAFDFIAYCFHSVDGYSKVGSYTGNGSTDGTFIYTGFRPAFVLLKISSASNDWILQDNKRDTYNAVGHYLRPNTNDAELDEDSIDFLSNGFKLRTTSGARNTSSGTYIYLAFAESPFKYSNAR